MNSYIIAEKFLTAAIRHPGDNIARVAERLDLPEATLHQAVYRWCGKNADELRHYFSAAYSRDVLIRQNDLFSPASVTNDPLIPAPVIHQFTPEEGAGTLIRYSYASTGFGEALLAETSKGLCFSAFAENSDSLFAGLREFFSGCVLKEEEGKHIIKALQFLADPPGAVCPDLHLRGTGFQRKVWNSLCSIAPGTLSTYGEIAASVGSFGAARAVGAAVGANRAAFFVPCHRVVNANGTYGNFRWGSARKKLMIAWEAAKYNGKRNHA